MSGSGLSRSNSTPSGGAAISRQVRPTAQTPSLGAAKPLPTVPKMSVQRSNTINAPLQRSNTNPINMKPGSVNTRYATKANPPVPPVVPSKTGPAVPSKAAAIIPKSQPPVSRAMATGLTRSNTAPMRSTAPTTSGGRTTPIAAGRGKPPVSQSTPPVAYPLRAGGGGLTPQPSLNRRDTSTGSGRRPDPSNTQPPVKPLPNAKALTRSKSESQRPAQTYTSRLDALKALKAPLPSITGAVGKNKNLVIAAEDNARVLDSGLPSQTSSHIVRVAESGGECLKEAEVALYGRHTVPSDRIIWNRTAESDKQMKSFLEWIDKVRWGLASLGLHKFLETKARGALIFNINGRLSNSPQTPAVDWITFSDAQRTLDAQLQQFISTYNPMEHVLVFAFRVMPSKDKLHIWGKKLQIPESLPVTYQAELTEIMKKVSRKKFKVLQEDEPLKRSASVASVTRWIKRRITR